MSMIEKTYGSEAGEKTRMMLNWPDKAGKTPLFYTAEYGMREMTTLLLDRGADYSIESVSGWTVLHAAVNGNNNEIVNDILAHPLVETKKVINKQDRQKRTALHMPQRAFPRFLATVPDFRYRLRRLKELRRLQANLNMRSGSAMSYKIDHSGGGGGAGPPSAAVRSGGGEGGGDAAPADRGPGPRRARARSRAGTSSRLAQASDNYK